MNTLIILQISLAMLRFNGPIDWKVGDRMEYKIKMPIVGDVGTMENTITKEEGDAVWLRQHTLLSPKNDTQDILVNRADGKVLKYLKNGVESVYDERPMEILSSTEESVTVPAGTFKSEHVVGKTEKQHLDIWTNAKDTAIDGAIKTVINNGSSIELTRFTHKE